MSVTYPRFTWTPSQVPLVANKVRKCHGCRIIPSAVSGVSSWNGRGADDPNVTIVEFKHNSNYSFDTGAAFHSLNTIVTAWAPQRHLFLETWRHPTTSMEWRRWMGRIGRNSIRCVVRQLRGNVNCDLSWHVGKGTVWNFWSYESCLLVLHDNLNTSYSLLWCSRWVTLCLAFIIRNRPRPRPRLKTASRPLQDWINK